MRIFGAVSAFLVLVSPILLCEGFANAGKRRGLRSTFDSIEGLLRVSREDTDDVADNPNLSESPTPIPSLESDQFRHPLDQRLTSLVRNAPFYDLAEDTLRRAFPLIEQGVQLDLLASSVKVSPQQLPELHDLLIEACTVLNFPSTFVPELYVLSGLRFFTVYGPRGRPDMAPFKFIDRVSRGVEMQQFGDGSSSRDYTYISDIVDGVIRAIDRRHKYEVFNLGKGEGTSLKEFIDLVQKYVGKKAIIKVLPDQPGDVPYTCADVAKAYEYLGYKSTISFEEGIRRTAEWYKTAYQKQEIEICPELQANGLGRAPSMVCLEGN